METINNIYGIWCFESSVYVRSLHLQPTQHGRKLLEGAKIDMRGRSIVFPCYPWCHVPKSLKGAVRDKIYDLKTRAREAHV